MWTDGRTDMTLNDHGEPYDQYVQSARNNGGGVRPVSARLFEGLDDSARGARSARPSSARLYARNPDAAAPHGAPVPGAAGDPGRG